MQLTQQQAQGIVHLQHCPEPSQGFFGIAAIVVTPENRARFEEARIGSAEAARVGAPTLEEGRVRSKALSKIWETAGFRELANSQGLTYRWDGHTYRKQKHQQSRSRSHAHHSNPDGAAPML